jgi:coproporphyrinogen III oxidase-like Fe-S oxidoreductase
MQWHVMVKLTGADGKAQVHEVHAGGGTPAACSPETLGLSLAEAKEVLAGLQRELVQA